MPPGKASTIKREKAEAKLVEIGGYIGKWVGNHTGHFQKPSRRSLYKQLRERGYEYNPRSQVWTKP
jgi:hypothetical protein